MEQTVLPLNRSSGSGQQIQVFYLDGHKVTVRYSEQENPAALRAIRDVLINHIPSKKS